MPEMRRAYSLKDRKLEREDEFCINGRVVVQWTLDITCDGGDTLSPGVIGSDPKEARPFFGM